VSQCLLSEPVKIATMTANGPHSNAYAPPADPLTPRNHDDTYNPTYNAGTFLFNERTTRFVILPLTPFFAFTFQSPVYFCASQQITLFFCFIDILHSQLLSVQSDTHSLYPRISYVQQIQYHGDLIEFPENIQTINSQTSVD